MLFRSRDATVLIGLLFVVLTWGALMAGLRAGAAHNTFPTMSGHWIPPGLLEQSPWWINLFENPTTVQFIHRWLAKLLVLGVLLMAWRARRAEAVLAAAMALVQLSLGIATILDLVSAYFYLRPAVVLMARSKQGEHPKRLGIPVDDLPDPGSATRGRKSRTQAADGGTGSDTGATDVDDVDVVDTELVGPSGASNRTGSTADGASGEDA